MLLRLGTASLRGDITEHARHFQLLELVAEKGKLPRASRLSGMARAVPEQFVFSVVLPRSVATLGSSPAIERDLAHALEVADLLRAGWLLLRTEATVMPTTRTRRALAELVERLPEGRRVGWEPRGVWEVEDTAALCAEIGVSLVLDVSREPAPPGDVIYTRLRALGRAQISEAALETVAAELQSFDEAYVVIEGERAAQAAATLRTLTQGPITGEEGEAPAP